MRILLALSLLTLSGCTFHVETKSDKQIEQDDITQSNEQLMKRCSQKCEPFEVIGIIPIDRRCLCGDSSK